MTMTQKSKGQQGFTLVELLVAITLLTVGLLAVAAMQTVALNRGAISYKISTATYLAREAMDDIMSYDISTPSLNASTNATYANNVPVQGGGTFNITYQTTVNTPALNITQIVVTVKDINNGIQPVIITSYKKVV